MKRKLLLIVLIGTLSQLSVFSQNDIQISHFMFCGQTYNPAFVSATKTIDASLLTRQQWVGFKNAPVTQLLNFKYSTKKIGDLGLSVINDKLGYEKSINLRLIYAYPFRLSEKSFLSAGLGLGFISRSIDGANLTYEDQVTTDPIGIYTNTSEYTPTIDFGLLFSNQKLILGASTTHISSSTNKATFFDVPRHYYIFGNYTIKLNEKINLVPAVYVKNSSVITQYEANANMIFNDKFWFGASYRVNESAVGLVGLRLFKVLKVAYAYDFNVGDVKSNSSGSHEIMLIAEFGKTEKQGFYYKSPRLFN